MNKTIKSKKVFFPRAWELVDNVGTNRLRVPGGWLIWSSYNENSESMTFMPDPKHLWKLVPLRSIKKRSTNA